ncbi:alcohol dehydrogenase catalytic domain-containing protein [Leifsonia bigeumensis]|uniref:Alcohol dehydrogenase catalytic domain-containing protein n=1 Tax=Leifsonella bigeumensis TaxID=433643 RepID=A0ABP7F8A4_9MICO
MKISVLREANLPQPYAESRPLQLEEVADVMPRRGEIAVRIAYSSLCHSDLSVVNGSRIRPLPMALGHEAVGWVTEVGDGVDDLVIGDHVVLVYVPSCGRCATCLSGRPALCPQAAAANGTGDLLHGEALLRGSDGERINHHLGVSAFADRAVVARESVVPISSDIPDEVAAMFGCAVLTGVGAITNTAQVTAGQSVAVFGLGAVGLAAVMGAALVGAGPIFAIDPIEAKRELALKAGATHVIAPDGLDALLRELKLTGVDIAVEAVGSARVIEAALAVIDRGGAVVTVGLPHPEQTLTVRALQFAGEGKRLLGSYMGDAVPARDIPRFLEDWRAGRLPIELLHTDTRPLDDLNESLDALHSGQVVRRLFSARRYE